MSQHAKYTYRNILRKVRVDALVFLELDAEDKTVVFTVNTFIIAFIEFMIGMKGGARDIQSDPVAPDVKCLIAGVAIVAISLCSNDG